MSTPSDARKRLKRKICLAEVIAITSLLLVGFLDGPEWLRTPLVTLTIGATIYGCLLTVKSNKARKEWLEKQPNYVDPYKGSPAFPRRKEGAAIMIGFCSFMAFVYLALPLKDRALASNDWWVLLPFLLMVAGFGYARRVHKKYGIALTEWREAQQATDIPQK
jgi:hypothetical protein